MAWLFGLPGTQLTGKVVLQWRWVKGHDGNRGDEAADKLANWGASGIAQKRPLFQQCGDDLKRARLKGKTRFASVSILSLCIRSVRHYGHVGCIVTIICACGRVFRWPHLFDRGVSKKGRAGTSCGEGLVPVFLVVMLVVFFSRFCAVFCQPCGFCCFCFCCFCFCFCLCCFCLLLLLLFLLWVEMRWDERDEVRWGEMMKFEGGPRNPSPSTRCHGPCPPPWRYANQSPHGCIQPTTSETAVMGRWTPEKRGPDKESCC